LIRSASALRLKTGPSCSPMKPKRPLVHSGCGWGLGSMMDQRQVDQAALFYLERHVPCCHVLRSIDRFVDLSDLRRLPLVLSTRPRGRGAGRLDLLQEQAVCFEGRSRRPALHGTRIGWQDRLCGQCEPDPAFSGPVSVGKEPEVAERWKPLGSTCSSNHLMNSCG